MKHLATPLRNVIRVVIALICATSVYAQTNALPTSGNVGIGTTSPNAALQVNGNTRIDSSLVVKDSVLIQKSARIKSDLKVNGDVVLKNNLKIKNELRVLGSSSLFGDVVIKEGIFKVKSLGDSTLNEKGVLLVNANGKVSNGGTLSSLVYAQPADLMQPCKEDLNGNVIYLKPTWQHDPQRMFLLSNNCMPDVKLGVGVKPTAKLQVRINNTGNTLPLLIEKSTGNNQTPYKLMQLDNTGLLFVREVKVNLNTWPDYVFEKEYPLMPLNELQQYIEVNKHLPNVPNAQEMKENGINIAESSVMLMEKIEELTRYVLQLNEQLQEQKEIIKQQQEKLDELLPKK